MAPELRVRIDWADAGDYTVPYDAERTALCDVSGHVLSVRYDRGKSSVTRACPHTSRTAREN